ncbi:MAG: hypothetical protein VX498_01385, partial [Myxococcota bacterium]|nr:hypothetical protein [Myxococcota bacterium]
MPADSPLQWSDWPLRRRPLRGLFAVVAILATTAVIGSLDPWLAFVGAVLLLGTCSEVLSPTRFELTQEGVRLHSLFRRVERRWDRFGGWQSCRDGFWLRGRTRSRYLQRRAALYLCCPGREE